MPGKPASSRGKGLKGRVSVVIPVEPGGSVEAALKALKALPKAEMGLICEVLVAEGRNPSRQRNVAVAQAKGEFIHFLDSDSALVPGALPRLVAAARLSGADVAAIGGPNIAPDNESPAGRAFDAILGSWLGSFTSAARYRPIGSRRDCTEKELILCNLFFKREVYQGLDGLREDLYPNEENELFNRALARGYRLVYEPQAMVQRPRRQSLSAFAYQAFRYGRGRMQQMRANLKPTDLINLAPLGFLVCFIATPFAVLDRTAALAPGVRWIPPIVLFSFWFLAGMYSLFEAVTMDFSPRHFRQMFFGYFARHLAYGVGLLAGLIQGPRDRSLGIKIRRERF